jgi:hypothetical protein
LWYFGTRNWKNKEYELVKNKGNESSDIRALMADFIRIMIEDREDQIKRRAEADADAKKRQKEADADAKKRKAEADARAKELDDQMKKHHKEMAEEHKKMNKMLKELSGLCGGMGVSNGMCAEEHFLNYFKKTKSYANITFDRVYDDSPKRIKCSDGSKIRGEFDVILVNCDSVALIEVKYRARAKDVIDLTSEKVKKFKTLSPDLSGHKLYLGLAGLSFDIDVQKVAFEYGIGILKQQGDSIEIRAENMIVY